MKLIIDTDPGDDDIVAILLALSWPNTQVLAYIASFGNVDVEHTYQNILKLYGVLDKHIKSSPESAERYASLKHVSTLIKGAAGPIEGPSPGDGSFFHSPDGLGNITKRYPGQFPVPDQASISHLLKIADCSVPYQDHILDILSQQEDKSVTWLVLGPMTSFTEAIRQDSDLVKRKVARVVLMGGAIERPGNFGVVAEWNIYADPYAAHEAFNHSQDLPIYITPLDITTNHLLRWPDYTEHIDSAFPEADSSTSDPLTYFTSAFFKWTKSQTELYCSGVFELHDPFTIWYALSNPTEGELAKGWEVKETDIHIERCGEYTKGMCVVDKRLEYGNTPPADSTAAPSSDRESDKHKIQIQIEDSKAPLGNKNRIYVVVRSPGSEALVNVMFQHIWGARPVRNWYSQIKAALLRLVTSKKGLCA